MSDDSRAYDCYGELKSFYKEDHDVFPPQRTVTTRFDDGILKKGLVATERDTFQRKGGETKEQLCWADFDKRKGETCSDICIHIYGAETKKSTSSALKRRSFQSSFDVIVSFSCNPSFS